MTKFLPSLVLAALLVGCTNSPNDTVGSAVGGSSTVPSSASPAPTSSSDDSATPASPDRSDHPEDSVDSVVTTGTDSVPSPVPAWSVDTSNCADANAVAAPISGPLTIGTVAPQSGGLASAVYAPVVEGFKAGIDAANADGTLGDTQLAVVVADDQGDPALTGVAVEGLLAAGASIVSGLIGSANNLAVRDLLNRQCVPQLMALGNSPLLGDVASAPWTLGGLVPVTVETTIYVNSIVRGVGEDGTVALVVTDDASGQEYANSFIAAASDTGLTVVDRPVVPTGDIEPPTAAILVMASHQPKAIVVALSGAACATFLTELAKARAATPGWNPLVYMSGACADSSILGLAGDAADGVLTSANLVSDSPDFMATMQARGLQNGFALAAEGWTAAEVTVAILAEAQGSPAGLSRQSIIDAARNLSYTPSLARPGVHYVTNGTDDPFPAESLQIIRFDAASRSFVDVGPLIAQFES